MLILSQLCWLLEDVREHFEKFGNVSDCIVCMDPSTGRSKGFGFVTFSDASAVDQVRMTQLTQKVL